MDTQGDALWPSLLCSLYMQGYYISTPRDILYLYQCTWLFLDWLWWLFSVGCWLFLAVLVVLCGVLVVLSSVLCGVLVVLSSVSCSLGVLVVRSSVSRFLWYVGCS